MNEAPVRLCCNDRHYGPVCPDGLVMCQLCYGRFEVVDLNFLGDGTPEDICSFCAEEEKNRLLRYR